MDKSRIVLRNIVVAFTLGVAAIATWAITDPHAPSIESVDGAQRAN
jgi:hypothetical protein